MFTRFSQIFMFKFNTPSIVDNRFYKQNILSNTTLLNTESSKIPLKLAGLLIFFV